MYDSATRFALDQAITTASVAATDVLDMAVAGAHFDQGKPIDALVVVGTTFVGVNDADDHLRVRLQSSATDFGEVLSEAVSEKYNEDDLVKGAKIRLALPRDHGRYVRVYYDLSNEDYTPDADAWVELGADYALGDVVNHDSKQWVSLEANNDDEPGGDGITTWEEVPEVWSFSAGKFTAQLEQGY